MCSPEAVALQQLRQVLEAKLVCYSVPIRVQTERRRPPGETERLKRSKLVEGRSAGPPEESDAPVTINRAPVFNRLESSATAEGAEPDGGAVSASAEQTAPSEGSVHPSPESRAIEQPAAVSAHPTVATDLSQHRIRAPAPARSWSSR
jgi:hypothetical protein